MAFFTHGTCMDNHRRCYVLRPWHARCRRLPMSTAAAAAVSNPSQSWWSPRGAHGVGLALKMPGSLDLPDDLHGSMATGQAPTPSCLGRLRGCGWPRGSGSGPAAGHPACSLQVVGESQRPGTLNSETFMSRSMGLINLYVRTYVRVKPNATVSLLEPSPSARDGCTY